MRIRIRNEEKKHTKWRQDKRELNINFTSKKNCCVNDSACKGLEVACERAVRVLLEYMRGLVRLEAVKLLVEAVEALTEILRVVEAAIGVVQELTEAMKCLQMLCQCL